MTKVDDRNLISIVAFYDRLKLHAEATPNRSAIIEKDTVTSYSELLLLVENIQREMRGVGVNQGKRILIYCREARYFIAAMIAAMETGALVLPAAVDLKPFERRKLIDLFGPHYVCTDLNESYFVEWDKKIHFLTISGQMVTKPIVHNVSENTNIPIQFPETFSLIHLTSGSSGTPKAIARAIGNLVDEAQSVALRTDMGPADNVLCTSPLHHSYACAFWRAAIYTGALIIVSKGFSPKQFVDICSEYKTTIAIGVPYLYMGISRSENAEQQLKSLRLAYAGGVKLTEETAHAFHKSTNVHLLQEYGLSEGGVVSLNDNPLKPESAGKPLPGVKISIVDETGAILPRGQIGEVYIARAYAPSGYWSLAEELACVLATPFGVPTGDLGWLDEEGYLYLAQRKKWIINVAGNKVDPSEVEDVLMQSGWLEECLVLPKKDDGRNEVVQAFVVTRKSEIISEDDLIKYCRQHLVAYKIPKLINFINKLQRTESGKIMRSYYLSEMN
ncbi:class I adenylate-forming enzyme family protein [Paenibacillus sp. MMS18-CY102]|uniref:class I adenylate-forming enzyme family protein n=1 Tax=Paenibacillus sp. MMS18-CY102 TaxID=2682849 RepID=UPI0013666108|nr:AMP-binding protein [Paenibacillus sp. MMS18-CY102]MWC30581.1 AMP-binding protein [Paenibacillus sp. MMS18-CY102]